MTIDFCEMEHVVHFGKRKCVNIFMIFCNKFTRHGRVYSTSICFDKFIKVFNTEINDDDESSPTIELNTILFTVFVRLQPLS